MKRFFCILSSVVIALTCFCFSVSAEEPPKGYEIGECVFDDEDFKSFMDDYITKYPDRVFIDDNGYYRVKDDYSTSSKSLTLRGFSLKESSPFYFVEYDLLDGGYIYLRFSNLIYPDASLAPSAIRSGIGNGFSVFNSLYPSIQISKPSSDLNYGVKSFRVYKVNLSGTRGLKNVGSSFGFMLGGVRDFITIVSGYPVLLLGIALFCCGCSVAVYYRLRS